MGGSKVIEEDNVTIRETWMAMEELVKAGLVRNIGVSNFNIQLIRDILSYCTIKPAVNQVEMHPLNTDDKLLRFCRSKGIQVIAYSNLGAGSYIEMNRTTIEESCLET